MNINLIYTILFFLSISLFAQTHTLQLKENQSPPKAAIEDAKWIEGHWRGEAFGGIIEEIWSPPLGESMMFVFKLIVEDSVSFYESGAIIEQDETLILRLKHFDRNFKGWEEKDETVDFRLVKVEKDNIYFEGFTFERINNDKINLYVDLKDKSGNISETEFNYKRFGKGCR